MLAVLERIDLGVVERLLAAASGESSLSMVRFKNQAGARDGTVPDGEIIGRFRYLFEVKTDRNAVRAEQIDQRNGHLSKLDGAYGDEFLFLITPDSAIPPAVVQVNDKRLIWFSFAELSEAIEGLLQDPRELVSEQTKFLLRELQALFAEDGLLARREVAIVAARSAYPEYLRYSAYVCQPNRTFADADRIGFYTRGAIQRELPTIRFVESQVSFTEDEATRLLADPDPLRREVGALIQRMLNDLVRTDGPTLEVVLLSSEGDPETEHIPAPIRNTKVNQSGLPVAWTMGQRYASLSALLAGPPTTGELDAAAR